MRLETVLILKIPRDSYGPGRLEAYRLQQFVRWVRTPGNIDDLAGSRKRAFFVGKRIATMRADDPSIDKLIGKEQFHTFPGTDVTVCLLSMKCGQQIVAHTVAMGSTKTDLVNARARTSEIARKRIANLETYRQRMEKSL